MTKPAGSTFVYVTYIRATPERLWAALTTTEFIKQYWVGGYMESEWKSGSPWQIVFNDGRLADTGEILESRPQERLVIKWRNEFREDFKAEGYSRCVFEIEPLEGVVKLTVTHSVDVPESKLIAGVSAGWPGILSNLKSYLETGEAIMTSWPSCAAK